MRLDLRTREKVVLLKKQGYPNHCAHFTCNYFSENNINLWLTPAESPDLNPIECVGLYERIFEKFAQAKWP